MSPREQFLVGSKYVRGPNPHPLPYERTPKLDPTPDQKRTRNRGEKRLLAFASSDKITETFRTRTTISKCGPQVVNQFPRPQLPLGILLTDCSLSTTNWTRQQPQNIYFQCRAAGGVKYFTAAVRALPVAAMFVRVSVTEQSRLSIYLYAGCLRDRRSYGPFFPSPPHLFANNLHTW